MTWQHLVGLGVAASTLAYGSAILVNRTLSLATGEPFRRLLWRKNGVRLIGLAGNLVLALGTLELIKHGSPAAAAAPVALVFLLAAYQKFGHVRNDRDAWRQVQGASSDLAVLDEGEFLKAAAIRSRELFSATAADLLIPGESGLICHRALLDDGLLMATAGPDPGPPTGNVTSTELSGPQGSLGELRLSFAGPAALSERERMILDTFRATVGVGLMNARLHAEAVRTAEQKAWEADHDALTGLGNRQLLVTQTAEALLQAAEQGSRLAVVTLNLDHFKQVNDTLGHQAGDELLREVSRRLTASTRGADIVCRPAGDTFSVLATNLPAAESGERVAEHLLEAIAADCTIEDLRLALEARAGVACFPEDAEDAESLLTRSELALDQTREVGRSVARYDIARDHTSLARLALAAELKDAIANDEIELFFQPQVSTATGRTVACEALARWRHPTRGLLLPDQFISTVEHSGLIGPFTMAVLDQALAAAARWKAAGNAREVSVNLSARSLLDHGLPERVAAALAKHRVEPDTLVLEITETVMMMSGLDVVEDVLTELRRLGVRIAVDDFGTGYSSLAFLLRAQVSELKIDRSFVQGLPGAAQARALVRASVELGHGLSARVVAEGVETVAQQEILQRLGCDRLQGYLFSRPVPEPALEGLVSALAQSYQGQGGKVIPLRPSATR